jgi:hypothetical protein
MTTYKFSFIEITLQSQAEYEELTKVEYRISAQVHFTFRSERCSVRG